MRIFERLRGRDRQDSSIELKRVATVAMDLLRRIEAETPVTVLPQGKSSCGAAEPEIG